MTWPFMHTFAKQELVIGQFRMAIAIHKLNIELVAYWHRRIEDNIGESLGPVHDKKNHYA